MGKDKKILIVGQGLAGTCLAWALWDRGIGFEIVAKGDGSGCSHVAAGMLTPVTGRGLSPAWRLKDFQPEALWFYGAVEKVLGEGFYNPKPILRIFRSEEERAKFEERRDELEEWVDDAPEELGFGVAGAHGGVLWKGGGWMQTHRFLTRSKGSFREKGLYRQMEVTGGDLDRLLDHTVILCEGAAGLGEGTFSYLPERRAKGEILTARIPGLREDCILSGSGGWIIPRGGGIFRAGAGYEWDDLTRYPTAAGREKVEGIISSLTSLTYEVFDHVAGVRPIVRRSQPVIGWHRERENVAIFNGLGSKGVLYAPGAARRLARHLCDNVAIEEDLDVAKLPDLAEAS